MVSPVLKLIENEKSSVDSLDNVSKYLGGLPVIGSSDDYFVNDLARKDGLVVLKPDSAFAKMFLGRIPSVLELFSAQSRLPDDVYGLMKKSQELKQRGVESGKIVDLNEYKQKKNVERLEEIVEQVFEVESEASPVVYERADGYEFLESRFENVALIYYKSVSLPVRSLSEYGIQVPLQSYTMSKPMYYKSKNFAEGYSLENLVSTPRVSSYNVARVLPCIMRRRVCYK